MKRYHLLYKLTCPRTGRYYIGMHSTNIVDDGYAGSGDWPTAYRRKYGNILKREIISYHSTRDEAYLAEGLIVTTDLIKTDKLCMNFLPGGGGPPDYVNQGLTKTNSPGRQRMVEKLTGRTKETHEYLARIGKKNSQRYTGTSKETHEWVARMANTLKGRSKETHDGVAAQAAKLTGRTKKTHNYLARHSVLMSGRTAETHPGIALRAEKCRKITKAQELQIFQLNSAGKQLKDIWCELNLEHLSYNTIVKACQRVKKTMNQIRDELNPNRD